LFTEIPEELLFDEINDEVIRDARLFFWEVITRDLITMSSLSLLRQLMGIEAPPRGFIDAIKLQTPERSRIIFIFLTDGLRWSFFNVSRRLCPLCHLPFHSEHIFSCYVFRASNARKTLDVIKFHIQRNDWIEVVNDILDALRWWAMNCSAVRSSFLSSI
jgi:hypothetical protein